ncbi:MAG: hypothetical protein Kow00129_17360 [Thermoleophilia bacterium]
MFLLTKSPPDRRKGSLRDADNTPPVSAPLTPKRRAPAHAAAEIEIDAPLQTVWDILTHVAGWPAWNPDVKYAQAEAPLRPGTLIKWRAGPGTIKSLVADVEPGSRLSWRGSMLGIKAIHVWTMSSAGAKTIVRSEESWEGLIPWIARRYARRTLGNALSRGLAALKVEAERSRPAHRLREADNE